MSLPIAYRARTLEEVAGNEETIRSLAACMRRKDKPHAYLFTGPSGTGKTTLARILAESLGAYDPNQPEQMSPDYTELDSATFRGVDMVREIRRKMYMKPMKSKTRVWFLDECHQLTGDAQEAFLKATEDGCPKHVYFIFATTEPQKLKPTFKRRCTQFDLVGITVTQIVAVMEEVVECEGVDPLDKKLLEQIARDANGSVGIALNILDKILFLEPEDRAEAARQQAERESETIELCRALMRKAGWKEVAKILGNTKSEPESVRRAVLGYCASCMLSTNEKTHHRAYIVMDCFRDPYYDIGRPGLIMSCYEATTV